MVEGGRVLGVLPTLRVESVGMTLEDLTRR